MEAELESSEALKFWEAVKGMKESIHDLARRAALAEESYEDTAAHFDNILSSVSDELREFVESQGEEQRQAYIAKCMEWIRGVHGSLDGTQFIPMVISNVTTHHTLAINQRVNQSQIPLQIMILSMCTQATTMGAGLKFLEFLSQRVLALDVKLGPASAVSLESGGEGAGIQSTSGEGGKATAMVASSPTPPEKHDSLKTPSTAHTPPMTDHIYGASKAKTPDTPAKPKTMSSPKASASFAKLMGMNDDENRPERDVARVPAVRFLPRRQKSMTTRTATPPLLPARVMCPRRKPRGGKRRKHLPLMTRAAMQVLRNGQPQEVQQRQQGGSKLPG